MAGTVNFVWNYCCETTREAQRRGAKWPTEFDLNNLMAGSSKELGLLSGTLFAVSRYFADSRQAARKCPSWRSRKGGSLGWIPLKDRRDFRIRPDGAVVLMKRTYRLWHSRTLPADAKIKSASFNEDARGRWYFNTVIEVAEAAPKIGAPVGIDLGLKDLATLSDGRKIETPAFYRQHETRLALAQQRGQKRRVRALHAKVSNCRRHFLHVHSTWIVREHGRVIVGDVSAGQLKQTKMAKSVSDAGWSMFRTMLQYKCLKAGASFEVVNEAWTTQACSDCGSIGGPKGIAGLGMREWRCEDCGASHDRDVNAARNILLGAERRPPDVGMAA